jgi:hypothetical protein
VAALAPASGTTAHEEGETHIESVEAAADGAAVSVSGAATFVDIPVTVSDDPSGDAAVAGIGTDITTVTFSRPDPAASTLRLVAGVADPAPQVHGAPVTLYHFPVAVNGQLAACGGGTGFWFPEARVASANPPDPLPSFRLMCDLSPGAVATGPTITGSLGGGTVQWQFSMTQIGAQAGDTLAHGGDCVDPGTSTSPPGASWLCSNGGGDGVFLEDYVIPSATVSLGVAPAGTPPDAVPTGTPATVDPATGSFSGSIAAPAEPGDYIAVARACYGPGNCGAASAPFTVT